MILLRPFMGAHNCIFLLMRQQDVKKPTISHHIYIFDPFIVDLVIYNLEISVSLKINPYLPYRNMLTT